MAVVVTDEEIDQAREAAGETSYTLVEARIASLVDAQRLRLKDLVAEWQKAATKFVNLTGKVALNRAEQRATIREQVRSMLGLPRLQTGQSGGTGGTVSVRNEFSW